MSSNNDLILTFFNICQEQIKTTREISNDLTLINNNMLDVLKSILPSNNENQNNRVITHSRSRTTSRNVPLQTRPTSRPPPPPPRPPPPRPPAPRPPPPAGGQGVSPSPPAGGQGVSPPPPAGGPGVSPAPLLRGQRQALSTSPVSFFQTPNVTFPPIPSIVTPLIPTGRSQHQRVRPPSTFSSQRPSILTPLFGRSRNQENIFENSTNDPWSFPLSNRTFRFGGENTFFDSPVRIRPNIRQIRSSTRILQYRDISSNQTICPIRRESFEQDQSVMQILQCSHIFDELSLRRHFRFSSRCPMCRYDIRDYELDMDNSTTSNYSTTYSRSYNTEPFGEIISQESRSIINDLNTAVENALRNTIGNQETDLSSSIVDIQYSVFFPSTDLSDNTIDNTIDDTIDDSIDNTIDNTIDDSIDNSIDDTIDNSIDDGFTGFT